MALSNARVVAVGETPYAHEKEGIDFAKQALPDTDPYHAWALVDLLDPSTGRLLEIDLLILGYSCLYLVELKAYPGRIEGDSVDWTWTTPEGRRLWRDNPRTLARRKAQILKSRLERALPADVRAPWIEPLIFLSDKDVEISLSPDGLIGVVGRHGFAKAITRHEFPGADPRQQGRAINRPTQRAVVQALAGIGFRARKGKLFVGPYELGTLLAETDSYQDREATHRDMRNQKARARTYLVPEQTSVERRQQLRRAADREAQLLYEVREHPNVLRYTEYVTDAPLGPTVLFDAFEGGIPLDAFLRREPELGFPERVDIVEQVGRALEHCHRREVVHGGIGPGSVLVRRKAGEQQVIETRLFNFQLGGSGSIEPTSHRSVLVDESAFLYQDPEVRKGQRAPDVASDVYGLGALAHLVFTGQPPGATLREVEERLTLRRCLDPRDVSDAVPAKVAELVASATHEVLSNRDDHVGTWVELLVDEATRPDPVEERSPLEARPGEKVGELDIVGILGHGASSRVLEVERRDGRRFALKISLGPDHDERLAAEAKVLQHLHHARIVQLEGAPLVIGGRHCLLLSLAGQALHRALAEQGAISLDYASRYGADLLGALEELEDKDVLHRDIKPANVGVGAVQKKSSSLTLFDFSLAAADPQDIGAGTAAYRDPFLSERGRWDHAADRYSAAVVLYEILTGQRPEAPLTPHAPVRVAAERFDPTVRATLIAFFQKAFAQRATDRHASAIEMRRDWERSFEARPEADPHEITPAEPAPLTDEAIAAIAPDTAIEALPLSNRAKNALDRVGVLRIQDLLTLPQNRLSAIRGVGRQVAKDIHEFRERWARLAHVGPGTAEPMFFPGYHGEDLPVHPALGESAAELLVDAGLRSLAQVASAPRTHIVHLAKRDALDEKAVQAVLSREHAKADELAHPTTLGAWVDALLPAKKRYQHARALFGLEGPFAGRSDVSPRELAEAQKLTPAAIYIAVGKSKDLWVQHPALAALTGEVHAIVDQAGGALPLVRAGAELLSRLPSGGEADAPVRAAALVRVIAEVEKDDVAGLRFVRLEGDAPWIVRSEELTPVVRRLGEVADELAARGILAGPAEAARALAQVTAGTPLADLPAERLVRLAAAGGRQAAVSSRLEVYPRGMDAERALALSSSVLTSPLAEDELRRRVAARYPEAAELPPLERLVPLLAAYQLLWVADAGVFARPSAGGRDTLHTSLSSTTHMSSLTARPGPEISASAVTVAEFDQQVRTCLERRTLLVLGVSADRTVQAEHALAARFGLAARSFDALFLAELDRQMEVGRVRTTLVYETDGAGPVSEGWPNLRRLAERTAEAVATAILPPGEPLLITQPGLIDRYQLVAFLRRLVKAAENDAAQAILLLAPGHEGGKPMIGDTPIPDLLPGQSVWIPKPWLTQHAPKAA